MNHKKAMSSAITYGVLVLITIVCLFPIVWMCLISIKDTSESITGFNSILVTHPTLGNFKRLFEMIPVGQNTFNSVFTTIMGTVTSLFFCALAGFAFAKYKFKGKEFFFISWQYHGNLSVSLKTRKMLCIQNLPFQKD